VKKKEPKTHEAPLDQESDRLRVHQGREINMQKQVTAGPTTKHKKKIGKGRGRSTSITEITLLRMTKEERGETVEKKNV